MICFVRHGQTDYNIQKIIQGQLDIPLNEEGIKQAEALRDSLKGYKFDCIYCSPLIRAKVTADIINEYHDVEIIYDERLQEINAGTKQGTPFVPEELFGDSEFARNPKKFNAESNEDFLNRVSQCYKEIEKRNQDILIVSHGGVYRCLQMYFDKQNTTKPINNCEFAILKE